MSTRDEFLKKAVEAEQLAQVARSEAVRVVCLEVAKHWRTLAEIELPEPKEKARHDGRAE